MSFRDELDEAKPFAHGTVRSWKRGNVLKQGGSWTRLAREKLVPLQPVAAVQPSTLGGNSYEGASFFTPETTQKLAAIASKIGESVQVRRLAESVQPSAAHLAVIRKIAKKTKIGDYDPRTVGEALDIVDPGWDVSVAVGLRPVQGPINAIVGQNDVFFAKWAETQNSPGLIVPSPFNNELRATWVYSPAPSPETNLPASFHRTDPPSKAEIQRVWDALLDLVLVDVVMEKAPAEPVDGQVYVAPVGKPKIETRDLSMASWRYGENAQSLSASVKLSARMGKEVIRLTAPNGETLDIEGARPTPAIWTWLYKTDIAQKAQDYLDGSGIAAADAKKKLMKGYSDNEVVGTCGVCHNVQKLRGGKLVLHGYQRPGYGWIQGSCFGVGYPAWELSSEVGEAYIKALDTMIRTHQNGLREKERAKTVRVWIDDTFAVPNSGRGYRDYTVSEDEFKLENPKKFAYSEIKARGGRSAQVMVFNPAEAKKLFDAVKAAAIRAIASDIRQMEESQKEMREAVRNWTAQPLPGASLEAFNAEMDALLASLLERLEGAR